MSKISVSDIHVHYPLQTAESASLKQTALSLMKGRKPVSRSYHALKGVTFRVEDGERVCLIGRNGAGKTTLLRAICGVLPVSSGTIDISGRISSLLDFATGFEMELTGWENIYIRGLILGMSRHEIIEKRAEIAEFADIGEFIHQPIRTYSSGMFVRLAFAIATSVTADILVAEEIVGAGDAAFAKRALARVKQMFRRGNTMVMATHSTELAFEYCSRAVWIEGGTVIEDGPIREVVERYWASVRDSA
jgi:ABC-type polysaccharide/polyol phosphate transport system ATPase subunit